MQTISQDEPSTSTCNARRILFELSSPSQDQTIGPKPNRVYKRRNRERAQHLTSSPYQKQLKKKIQRKSVSKATKKIVLKKKAIGKKVGKKFVEDFENSDDERWPCLVCGEPYANSRLGEK